MVRLDPKGRILSRTEVAAALAGMDGWECEPGAVPRPGALAALARRAARVVVACLAGGAVDPVCVDVPWDGTPSGGPDAIFVPGALGAIFHRPLLSEPARYLDLGMELAVALREALPPGIAVPLPRESVRATVVGVGVHSIHLAGPTIHDSRPPGMALRDARVVRTDSVGFPPAWVPPGPVAWVLGFEPSVEFDRMVRSADSILGAALARGDSTILAVVEADLAKAYSVALRMACGKAGAELGLVCLDGLRLAGADLLDVGMAQEGGAIPVVARTLLFPSTV